MLLGLSDDCEGLALLRNSWNFLLLRNFLRTYTEKFLSDLSTLLFEQGEVIPPVCLGLLQPSGRVKSQPRHEWLTKTQIIGDKRVIWNRDTIICSEVVFLLLGYEILSFSFFSSLKFQLIHSAVVPDHSQLREKTDNSSYASRFFLPYLCKRGSETCVESRYPPKIPHWLPTSEHCCVQSLWGFLTKISEVASQRPYFFSHMFVKHGCIGIKSV